MGASLTGVRQTRHRITLYEPDPEYERQQELFRHSFRALLGSARTLNQAGLKDDAAEVYRAAFHIGLRKMFLQHSKRQTTRKSPEVIAQALFSWCVIDRETLTLIRTLFDTKKPFDMKLADDVCYVMVFALCDTATSQAESDALWQSLLGTEAEA